MEVVKIKGEVRKELGKKSTKALRREGLVPCNLYGKNTSLHFSANPVDFKEIIYTPNFKKAEVEVDGEMYRCIIKKVDFHPVTEEILHIDLLKLVEGRKVRVQIPVHLQGTPPGVVDGGRLVQTLRKAEIKTTPDQLINELFVDVSNLLMGETVRVKHIGRTDQFEILNHPSIPVASVQVPRTLKTAAEMLEEGAVPELDEEGEPIEGVEGEEGEGTEEGREGGTEETPKE
jgi:large subunit ribosomal protein L25